MADKKKVLTADIQKQSEEFSPGLDTIPGSIFTYDDIPDSPPVQYEDVTDQSVTDNSIYTPVYDSAVIGVNQFTLPDERIANALQGHVSFVQESFQVGNNQIKASSAIRQVMNGERTFEEVQPEIDNLYKSSKQIEYKSLSPQDLAPFIIGSTIEQLPILGEIAKGAGAGAAIGGTAGAIAGAPGGFSSAGALAAKGASVGGLTGLVATSYELNSAEAYYDYRMMGFSHGESMIMARVYGGAATILDVVTLKIGAGVAKKLMSRFIFSTQVKRALAKPILAALADVSVGAFKEGLTEAAQSLTENVVAWAWALATKYDIKKLPKPAEIMAGAFASFAKGAAATVGIGGAGITLSVGIQKSIQSFESKPFNRMTGPMIAKEMQKLSKKTKIAEAKASIAKVLSSPDVVQKMAEVQVAREVLKGYIDEFIHDESGSGAPGAGSVEAAEAAAKGFKKVTDSLKQYYDNSISEKFSLTAEERRQIDSQPKEAFTEENDFVVLDDARDNQILDETDTTAKVSDFFAGALERVDFSKPPGESPILNDKALAEATKGIADISKADNRFKESLTHLVRWFKNIRLKSDIQNTDFTGKLFLYLTSPDVLDYNVVDPETGKIEGAIDRNTIERLFPMRNIEASFYTELSLELKDFFNTLTNEMGMTLPEVLDYMQELEKVQEYEVLTFAPRSVQNPQAQIIDYNPETGELNAGSKARIDSAISRKIELSKAQAISYYGKSKNATVRHSFVESNGIVSPEVKEAAGRVESTLYEVVGKSLTDQDKAFIAGVQKSYKKMFPRFQQDLYVLDGMKIFPEDSYFGMLKRIGSFSDSFDTYGENAVRDDVFNSIGIPIPDGSVEPGNVNKPGQAESRVRSTSEIIIGSPFSEVITYINSTSRYRHYRGVSRTFMKGINSEGVKAALKRVPLGDEFRKAVTDHLSNITLSPKTLKQIHGADLFSKAVGGYLPSFVFGGNPLAIVKQAAGAASALQFLTPGQVNRVSQVLKNIDSVAFHELKAEFDEGRMSNDEYLIGLKLLLGEAVKDSKVSNILNEEDHNFADAVMKIVGSLGLVQGQGSLRSNEFGQALITTMGHVGFKVRFEDPQSTVTGSGRGPQANLIETSLSAIGNIKNSPMQDLNFSAVLQGDKYSSSVISTFVYINSILEGKGHQQAAEDAFAAVDRTQSSGLLSSRQLSTLQGPERFLTFALQSLLAQRQELLIAKREYKLNPTEANRRKVVHNAAAIALSNSAFGATALIYSGIVNGFDSDEFKTAFVLWMTSSLFPARSPVTNAAVIAFGPTAIASIIKSTTGIDIKTYGASFEAPGQSGVARIINSANPLIKIMLGANDPSRAPEVALGATASAWLAIPLVMGMFSKTPIPEPPNLAPFFRMMASMAKSNRKKAEVTNKEMGATLREFNKQTDEAIKAIFQDDSKEEEE